jgi:hypothetical protein
MVITQKEGMGVKVTQDKWSKNQQLLKHTLQLIDLGGPIDRKVLESYRGSLVYLQRTYPAITPYVKGFHLTIDAWRPDQDPKGWRLPRVHDRKDCRLLPPTTPRDVVMPVPRFRDDVLALLCLFNADTPPIRLVRSQAIRVACYSFADASGCGFGRTVGIGSSLSYTHGVWEQEMDLRTSNYRELINLAETLEHGVKTETLHNVEVWIFTDNSTLEAVFWKGHSPSRLLNDLALWLRLIELTSSLRVHMVHIPGTRMISQGTDRLTRGDYTEGVMQGTNILKFVPLNRDAISRQPALLDWICSWTPAEHFYPLSVDDWFDLGQGISSCT